MLAACTLSDWLLKALLYPACGLLTTRPVAVVAMPALTPCEYIPTNCGKVLGNVDAIKSEFVTIDMLLLLRVGHKFL